MFALFLVRPTVPLLPSFFQPPSYRNKMSIRSFPSHVSEAFVLIINSQFRSLLVASVSGHTEQFLLCKRNARPHVTVDSYLRPVRFSYPNLCESIHKEGKGNGKSNIVATVFTVQIDRLTPECLRAPRHRGAVFDLTYASGVVKAGTVEISINRTEVHPFDWSRAVNKTSAVNHDLFVGPEDLRRR